VNYKIFILHILLTLGVHIMAVTDAVESWIEKEIKLYGA